MVFLKAIYQKRPYVKVRYCPKDSPKRSYGGSCYRCPWTRDATLNGQPMPFIYSDRISYDKSGVLHSDRRHGARKRLHRGLMSGTATPLPTKVWSVARDCCRTSDFLLKLQQPIDQGFGRWRAARDIDIDRHDAIAPANNSIGIVIITAAIGA